MFSALGCQLDKNVVGNLTWRTGIQNSMATSIHRNTDKSSTSITLLFGIPTSYLSFSYTRKFYENEKLLKLKLATK